MAKRIDDRPSVAASRFRFQLGLLSLPSSRFCKAINRYFHLQEDEDSFIPRASIWEFPAIELRFCELMAQIGSAQLAERHWPPPVLNFGFGDPVAILAFSFTCKVTVPRGLLSLRQPHGIRD